MKVIQLKRLKQEILLLLKKEPRSFWNLVKNLPYTLREMAEETNLLHKEKLIETRNQKIYLTKKGLSLIEKNGWITPISWNKSYEKKLLKQFLKETRNRPNAIEKFDQGIIFPENTVERAVIMGKRFDVDRKKILLIGDDDLVSIALALTGRAKEIVVLEADERLNEFINSFAERNSFPLKALTWSVEEELPFRFRKQFDVFLTDPVETLQGIKAFLGRGISSLKGIDSCFYFSFTSIDAGRTKWHSVQKMILNAGFILTDIIRDQAFYSAKQFESFKREEIPKEMIDFPLPEAETYFRSNFIRCLAVKKIKPLIKGKIKLSRKFYHDKETF
jgi:hypothetical protein